MGQFGLYHQPHDALALTTLYVINRRFGFANPDALASGETGTACRGEEHDITIVWSLTSGKRMILADGQEVHYSSSRTNIFEYSWTMKGNHVLKIIAHAAPPLSPTPGFRQYDFFVNGQSFFSFPKVFRLGLAPNDPRARSPGTAQMAEASHRYTPGTVGRRSNSSAGIVSLEAPGNVDEVCLVSNLQFHLNNFILIGGGVFAGSYSPVTSR